MKEIKAKGGDLNTIFEPSKLDFLPSYERNNFKKTTYLHWAFCKQDIDAFNYLLANGFNPNAVKGKQLYRKSPNK